MLNLDEKKFDHKRQIRACWPLAAWGPGLSGPLWFSVLLRRVSPVSALVSAFELRSGGELHGVGLITCKRGEIVQGDEGPVGGVAQVVGHGVKVGVGHREEGQEEKGEKQGEVEGEVEKLKDNRTSWMVWRWGDKRVNGP